jgi:type IV pilus assembly protein PilY1
MRLFNKSWSYTAATAVLLILASAPVHGQSMTPYCCAPPYVTEVVQPNIMILMDNSGSMGDRAYQVATVTVGDANDQTLWYGYFIPESMYTYASNRFSTSPTGLFPGRILNLACMARGDVLRKVLVGGHATSQFGAGADPIRLESEGRNSWNFTYRRDAMNYNTFTINHGGSGLTSITMTKTGANPPINTTLNGASGQIEIHRALWNGVLQQIAGKEVSPNDWEWRDDAPRFGLFIYNLTYSGGVGGNIRSYIGGSTSLNDLSNEIQNTDWTTNTPLCETYFEILHYFSQSNPHYMNSNYNAQPGGQHDPQYINPPGGGNSIPVPCMRNFILAITDGEPTVELQIPNNETAHLPGANNLRTWGRPFTVDQGGASYVVGEDMDEVAFYGNTRDLRAPGYRDVPDSQNVAGYIIYCFGTSGATFLSQVAKCAGFQEKGGAWGPDLRMEWDADSNNVPDNYFQAQNGNELEDAILSAIMQMMARISSGSGASVICQGGDMGGITSQGQFYPRRNYSGVQLDWMGNLYSIWLDSLGLMREDSDTNGVLGYLNDLVIKRMYYNGTDVVDSLCRDMLGNGKVLQYVKTVGINDLKKVWDGGLILYNRSPDNRTITAFTDLNKNHLVDAGENTLFIPAHAGVLRPYLNVASNGAADTLIRYIRGQDFANLRTRTALGHTWKLGDIISSTPVSIGAPVEKYDYIYSDLSYSAYATFHANRRPVLYTGANDGMLHAFNAGLFDPTTGQLNGLGRGLGEELWAYIPYNLLPHLKWLSNLNYCHVYYVDEKPYVSEAKIFPPDVMHVNGWGNILIGGMRMGGGSIAIASDTCRSAYFMLDVTDPLNPVPMWEFRDDSLNFSSCYSTLVKVGTPWFLVLSSGPMTCGGECTRPARIYILDLATGTLLRKITLPDANSFITNIFALDWNRDYNVDFIYFGTCQKDNAIPGGWGGKIYRISTLSDPLPSSWTMTMLMDMQRPISGEGTATNDPFGNRWVYFGTGRFFNDVDESDTTTRQLYVGFRDDTTISTNPLNLYNSTGIQVDTGGRVHLTSGIVISWDSLITLCARRLGWYRYLNAAPGERSLTTSLCYGGGLFFTTFAPQGEICSYGGQGYLYALYYRTGTAYKDTIIGDTLGNNRFNLYLGSGMPSEPSIYMNKILLQRAGAIDQYEYDPPEPPRSGVVLWKGR